MKTLLLWVCLGSVLSVDAQQVDYAMFDFYYVPIDGDTVREGIEEIRLVFSKHGQLAVVTFTDGSKKRFGVAEISAFSFIEPNYSVLWKHFPAVYHQVQTINFTQTPRGNRMPVFYEKIGECNGHILYRDFVYYDEDCRYLLAKGLVVKQLLPIKRMADARKILMELMPDCIRSIDVALWPKWAKKHYQKIAPTKP